MHLPILIEKVVTEAKFVAFWSERYLAKRDHLYSPNVGKPLTEKRVLELFLWKNGGPIAKHKLKSIRSNYIDQVPKLPATNDRERLIEFIRLPGGAIWRIFWLHCKRPEQFPIFDQHVYRAMCHLRTGICAEIPGTNLAKAKAYVDEYLPFYAAFGHKDKTRLDRALWAYGKHLKGKNAL